MNKRCLFAIPLALLLLAAIFMNPSGTFIRLAFAADAYGNDIDFMEIWQWNGTDYLLRWNITSDPSGATYRIYDNQTTKFVVCVRFNDTLASSVAEAIDFTRVYMNISTVWTNELLNYTANATSGGFYWIWYQGIWDEAGKPEGGVTYECAVKYQGYY